MRMEDLFFIDFSTWRGVYKTVDRLFQPANGEVMCVVYATNLVVEPMTSVLVTKRRNNMLFFITRSSFKENYSHYFVKVFIDRFIFAETNNDRISSGFLLLDLRIRVRG